VNPDLHSVQPFDFAIKGIDEEVDEDLLGG
jgi:hypothetical protein